MRQRAFVIIVLVGLLASLATPTGVAADSRFGGRGGATFSARHRAPALHAHGFQHHRGFRRHHLGGLGVVIAAPIVVHTPPVFATPISAYTPAPYAPPVMYSAPPVAYSPTPTYAEPAPAPLPRIVEHPHGRYELRGDGVSTPYTWVWIPNPPPPPPAPLPAATPNGAPTSRGALPAREQIYQWVDDQGVANWTNRMDRVPRRYREQASQ